MLKKQLNGVYQDLQYLRKENNGVYQDVQRLRRFDGFNWLDIFPSENILFSIKENGDLNKANDWISDFHFQDNYTANGAYTAPGIGLISYDDGNSYGNWVWRTKSTVVLKDYSRLCCRINLGENYISHAEYPNKFFIMVGRNLNLDSGLNIDPNNKNNLIRMEYDMTQPSYTRSIVYKMDILSYTDDYYVLLMPFSHSWNVDRTYVAIDKVWLE